LEKELRNILFLHHLLAILLFLLVYLVNQLRNLLLLGVFRLCRVTMRLHTLDLVFYDRLVVVAQLVQDFGIVDVYGA
jgi:hypothetical protein